MIENDPRLKYLNNDFPEHVSIQIGSVCNAKCLMCPYPKYAKELGVRHIDWKLYKKIVDECSKHKIARISPILFEEPLIEKDIVKYINYAKLKNKKAQVNITTNGSLMTKEIARQLAYSKLDAIFISFQGINKSTYESTTGLSYEKVLNNILYFIEVVKRKPCFPFRKKRPTIVISSVHTRMVESELKDAKKFWEEKGVLFETGSFNNFGGHLDNYPDKCMVSEKIIPFASICERVFNQIYISSDGKAVVCCADYKKEVVFGDLNKESIFQIWNNPKYKEIRKKFIDNDFYSIPLCKNCLLAV